MIDDDKGHFLVQLIRASNVLIGWLTLLLGIHEVPNSDLGPNTG
jgi:hypothetical protein